MAIDATKPADGTPAVKADLRANLQAAKDGIEGAGGSADSSTSITINAASFGDSMDYFLISTANTAVTVTLATDVPAKKTLHVLRRNNGNITVQSAGSPSNLLTGSVTTTAQFDSFVFRSIGGGDWVRMQTT